MDLLNRLKTVIGQNVSSLITLSFPNRQWYL